MSLDIGSTGEKSHAKFNAKTGKWTHHSENGDSEINQLTCIFDFDHILTGWVLFREGQSPSRVFDPAPGIRAPQPTPDHKRGFALNLYSKNSFGGVAELSSGSLHLCNAIRDAFSQYEAAKANNPGRVPVFTCTDVQPSRDRFGQNFRPTLQLAKWVDRPADLPDEPAVRAEIAKPAPRPAPAPTPSTTSADLATAEF
jgi:hypothetical protein